MTELVKHIMMPFRGTLLICSVMAGRRTYNEHLLYSDPFSKSVANRTTRFRRKRERNAMVVNDIAPNGATENAIESCDMIYDATSSFQADFQSQEQTICIYHMNTMTEEVESVEQELQDTMTVHGESMESQRSYYTDTELPENSEQEDCSLKQHTYREISMLSIQKRYWIVLFQRKISAVIMTCCVTPELRLI